MDNTEQSEISGVNLQRLPAVHFLRIDHIAIAVVDLEAAIRLFTETLGFTLVRRLEVKGAKTGMLSAEMEMNQIKFVLCQGTEPESQVSKLIAHYGPGVAHIAFEVSDVHGAVESLTGKGLRFDTAVIGAGNLQQAFSSRDQTSGLAFEFIRRNNVDGFSQENVKALFEQLEQSNSY